MAKSPADIAAPPSRPTQFSLRSVLLLTAAVAGACALVSWLGAVWLPLLLGMTLYLVNYLGMLGFLQGRRVAQAALYLASAGWGVSMFLPLGNESGWQLFWEVFKAWPLGLHNDPEVWPTHRDALWFARISWLIGAGLFCIANLAMPLCALLAHRLAVGKARWLRTLLALVAPALWVSIVLVIFNIGQPEFLIRLFREAPAFPVWCAALTIPAFVLPITRGQLIGATLVSLLLAVGAWDWISISPLLY